MTCQTLLPSLIFEGEAKSQPLAPKENHLDLVPPMNTNNRLEQLGLMDYNTLAFYNIYLIK
jgi:hypothetical protein